MVTKSMSTPNFDLSKYGPVSTAAAGSAVTPEQIEFGEIFNEIVYKMAQYYFAVFQAIFSKDNESVRPSIQDFLSI